MQPAVQNMMQSESSNFSLNLKFRKKVNEFAKCDQIYCLLLLLPFFAGSEASAAPSVPSTPLCSVPGRRMPPASGCLWGQTSPSPRLSLSFHCSAQAEEARCSDDILSGRGVAIPSALLQLVPGPGANTQASP